MLILKAPTYILPVLNSDQGTLRPAEFECHTAAAATGPCSAAPHKQQLSAVECPWSSGNAIDSQYAPGMPASTSSECIHAERERYIYNIIYIIYIYMFLYITYMCIYIISQDLWPKPTENPKQP